MNRPNFDASSVGHSMQHGLQLSTKQFRAVRKELLLNRAALERFEFQQAAGDLRETFTHFNWLKRMLPFGLGRRGARRDNTPGMGGRLASILALLSSLPRRAAPRRAAGRLKPVLRWGSLGLAGWEAVRAWKRLKPRGDVGQRARVHRNR